MYRYLLATRKPNMRCSIRLNVQYQHIIRFLRQKKRIELWWIANFLAVCFVCGHIYLIWQTLKVASRKIRTHIKHPEMIFPPTFFNPQKTKLHENVRKDTLTSGCLGLGVTLEPIDLHRSLDRKTTCHLSPDAAASLSNSDLGCQNPLLIHPTKTYNFGASKCMKTNIEKKNNKWP